MFADDICVFCPSVRGYKVYLMCVRLMQNCMELFSMNCSKTVCMVSRPKSAKSTVTPLLTLGGQMYNLLTTTKKSGNCTGY